MVPTGPPRFPTGRPGVALRWFVLAVALAIVFAGVSAALILGGSPSPSSPSTTLPGVNRVLVEAQGVNTRGYYLATFNISSTPNGSLAVPVEAVMLTNLTCQSPLSLYGPFCDYFLIRCPCNVQYVTYVWLDLPIVGTFALNSTSLSPAAYEFGVNAVNQHPPLEVSHIDLTLSVEVLEFD
ncbi:MAG TPA: hypothetical protein VFG07_07870 [Thermoplasmata archaeon]|nr:hypothetical protein [Thermoplasmata archaeon]